MTRMVSARTVIGVVLGLSATPVLAQDGGFVDDGGARRYRGRGVQMGRGAVIPPTHTVVRGDTLWDISHQYYGDPYDWPRLWSYNPEITNPHWIYPEASIRLVRDGVAATPTRAVRADRAPMGTLFLQEEGYLDREALEQLGTIVAAHTDRMFLSDGDEVIMEFPDDARVREGEEFVVFHQLAPDERLAAETGTLRRIFGAVHIDSWDREHRQARGTIIDSIDPIERGFVVAPVARKFVVVAPRQADIDLDSNVVATLMQREVIGAEFFVFLDVGEENHVEPGHRFRVVRRRDEFRHSMEGANMDPGWTLTPPPEPTMPEQFIAEIQVVHVRPRSCTGWVTWARDDIHAGDRAVMREGY